MKCCPSDKEIKEKWEQNMEQEVAIDENEIKQMCLSKQDYCVESLVLLLI